MKRRSLHAGVLAALVLHGCAAPPKPPVPPQLQPPTGAVRVGTLHAHGVQVYECRAAATGSAWTFVAPEAELLDFRRRHAGVHGAGPTWSLTDGSAVAGAVTARADAPGHGHIPWLLLSATSTGGAGLLRQVGAIQRVNTVGGVAPRDGCDDSRRGRTARVPYSADYHFFSLSHQPT